MDPSSRQTSATGVPKRSKLPVFYKIVDPSSVKSHKLMLPKKFASEYRADLGSIVHLKVPSGAVWEVELITSADNETFLAKGWEEFAKYYSIGLLHFLVFTYEGNSNFSVLILDKSAVELDYPFSPQRVEREYDETDSSGPVLSNGIHEMKDLARTGGGNSIALERAKSFESKNPWFRIRMKRSHIEPRGDLNIPIAFSREHISEQQKYVKLQVPDCGRAWEVRCYFCTVKNPDRRRLGLHSFVLDNKIEVGDVCVFELIDPVEPLLNVIIFRQPEEL